MQRNGFEVTRACGLGQLCQVVSAQGYHSGGGILGDPGFQRQPAETRQHELLPGPRRLDDVEAVAGRGSGVDHDRTHGAGAGSAFVLVGPATVVQPFGALEEFGVPVGVVVEHQQDLAVEVGAFEVVPVFLGCRDAVADEDDLGRLDRNGFFDHSGRADVVVPELQVELSVGSPDRPGPGHLGGEPHQLDWLFPAARAVSGLEAVALELLGDEGSRRAVALAGRAAALERVVCQLGDGGFQ